MSVTIYLKINNDETTGVIHCPFMKLIPNTNKAIQEDKLDCYFQALLCSVTSCSPRTHYHIVAVHIVTGHIVPSLTGHVAMAIIKESTPHNYSCSQRFKNAGVLKYQANVNQNCLSTKVGRLLFFDIPKGIIDQKLMKIT